MAIQDWGLTDAGFYCPTYNEILASKITSAKELFGENICTDNNTPLGKFIRLESTYDQKLFECIEQIYYGFSPTTATGVSLDRAVSFGRITRNTATAAVHTIRIYGTLDHTLGKGTLVKSSKGVVFYTTTDCTISKYEGLTNDIEMYYAEVNVQCTEAGTIGNVYDINSLVNVDPEVNFVVYVKTITDGTDTETDLGLYNRYNEVIDGLGTNTENSITAELLKINGVHNVSIIVNESEDNRVISENLTIESGKYAVIVYANSGLDSEIAAAIFKHKPFGIKQNGSVSKTVTDSAGETHTVTFSYVNELTPEIHIECKVNSEFSSSGIKDIEANITGYINSLNIGKPLIYSKLYEKIYSVAGTAEIVDLKVDGDTKSIYPTKDAIVRVDAITITITEE